MIMSGSIRTIIPGEPAPRVLAQFHNLMPRPQRADLLYVTLFSLQ